MQLATATMERPTTPLPPNVRVATPRKGTADADGFGRQLARLMEQRAVGYTHRRFDGGATIYCGPAPDDSPYLIVSGRVKTVLDTRSGKKCLLRIHGPGEVIGELALMGDARIESAVAMEDVEVARISAAGLQRAMTAPEVYRQLLRHLSRRLCEQQQAISHLVADDSEHRLGVTLLDLAERLGHAERGSILLAQRITQGELAEIVGTTRSRIGFFLRRFQQLGAVEFARGKVVRVFPAVLQHYLDTRSTED